MVALEEAYEVEATIPLGCHATETRQEHHQVNQSNVTSKFKQDLRILKPWALQSSSDRSWVSLPTHNQRGEHQARKEQFMLAQGQGVDYDKRLVKLSSNKFGIVVLIKQ